MKKLELLLLEDKVEEAKELASVLELNNYITTIANTITEAQKEIENKLFDVIILDIMIDGKPEGITFAYQLNKQKYDVPFLFLTSIRSKTIFEEAKYTKPFNYLLKPYNNLELFYALELAIASHYNQSNMLSTTVNNAVLCPEFLFVKKMECVVKVELNAIEYIEVSEKYCSLFSNSNKYSIKLSLTKLKSILSNPSFIQVHRNYLVNIKKVREIYFEDNLIVLDNDAKIPFTKKYKPLLLKDNIIFR